MRVWVPIDMAFILPHRVYTCLLSSLNAFYFTYTLLNPYLYWGPPASLFLRNIDNHWILIVSKINESFTGQRGH